MFSITPYERRYRSAMLDLMFYSRLVHSHLDWHEMGQWLDTYNPPMRLLWDDALLVAFIGVSPPLNNASWLRLVALHEDYAPRIVLRPIWESLLGEMRLIGVKTVAILVINEWLEPYLPELGMSFLEEIITLHRSGPHVPPARDNRRLFVLRTITTTDIEQIVQIDHTAFVPPWQMSHEEIRQAQRHTVSAMVALKDDKILGFQLSTRRHANGHLARLAVSPSAQGQGVGATILDYLIRNLYQRGIRTLTVNTQVSNVRSQHLYERYGFRRNGYDLPVWIMEL